MSDECLTNLKVYEIFSENCIEKPSRRCCLRMPEMKFSGKPYAGKLHVRFDEEGWLSNPYSTALQGAARVVKFIFTRDCKKDFLYRLRFENFFREKVMKLKFYC